MQKMFDWKTRFLAAGVHLGASALVAALAATLVFLLWFPFPYRDISGGRSLFMLVVAVDVVLGPLLTWVVFDLKKPRSELFRDLAVIAFLQLLALSYGLWSVYQARPVYLVHEVDRFVAISAADVDSADLPKAAPEFQELPFAGVRVIGLRASKDSAERMASFELALAGKDLALRPEYWQELSEANKAEIRQRAKPVQALMDRSSDDNSVLSAWITAHGRKVDSLLYLPLAARQAYWTALLDKHTLDIVGYVQIDSF